MRYIYIVVFEKQDPSGQTINKRVLSFDNVKVRLNSQNQKWMTIGRNQ